MAAKYTDKMAQVQREIARLELLRGSAEEPPALNAQISLLQRRLRWYERRQERRAINVGRRSLARAGRPALRRVIESPLTAQFSA